MAEPDQRDEPDHRDEGDRRLDPSLQRLFWDCNFSALSLPADTPFVIDRIMDRGDLADFRWARATFGEGTMRERVRQRRGRGMDRMRLRFWQLILGLTAEEVDGWLADRLGSPWEHRLAR